MSVAMAVAVAPNSSQAQTRRSSGQRTMIDLDWTSIMMANNVFVHTSLGERLRSFLTGIHFAATDRCRAGAGQEEDGGRETSTNAVRDNERQPHGQ
ncbi:hypothetical protein E4U55_003890, partial [Claviceps digitariae]